MNATPAEVIALTKLLRRCFQQLKTLGDRLHADLGMNASLRATLEWLAEHGRQTVPQIAAAKSVSRQHVQKTVDELLARGLVENIANPGHKRSPFVGLTEPGRMMFAAMTAREKSVVVDLAGGTSAAEFRTAIAELEKLSVSLSRIMPSDSKDDIDG